MISLSTLVLSIFSIFELQYIINCDFVVNAKCTSSQYFYVCAILQLFVLHNLVMFLNIVKYYMKVFNVFFVNVLLSNSKNLVLRSTHPDLFKSISMQKISSYMDPETNYFYEYKILQDPPNSPNSSSDLNRWMLYLFTRSCRLCLSLVWGIQMRGYLYYQAKNYVRGGSEISATCLQPKLFGRE